MVEKFAEGLNTLIRQILGHSLNSGDWCIVTSPSSTKSLGSAKNANKVSRINLVLDHKATNKTLKLWAFIAQVIERTYLADNHSKILLVRSENGDTVSVITSQNLTRSNRHESAFISTSPEIFANLYDQVNDLITNHSVPFHDLFRERLAAD